MSAKFRIKALGVTLGVLGLTFTAQATPASAANGVYELQNVNSGRCLEIYGWGTGNGAQADQWDCTGGANQHWTMIGSNGIVTITNINSGKCLEIADWRTDNGAPARQWDCTGGANQQWQLTYVGGGTVVRLQNVNSGKCLEIYGWGTGNGAQADQPRFFSVQSTVIVSAGCPLCPRCR